MELTGPNLKYKYRAHKPRSRYKADYMGNSGKKRAKHVLLPMVPGIKIKTIIRRYVTLKGKGKK
jgi:hypothetical protein